MKYYLPEKIYCLKYDGEIKDLLKKAPLQVNLSPEGCTSFKKGDALVLDFGKENCGGLRVLTCTVMKGGKFAEGRIHITFGESYMEALSRVGEKGAGNDHAIRDFTAELTSYSDMTFGDTGYRYVRVEFIDDAEYLIKRFFGGCEIKRRKQIYKYNGKDPLISKIFSVAKRTIDLCSSRGYVWDGIKRDRLIWAGDIYPEMLALVTLYGRCAEVENSLDYVLAETGEGEWMNTVPAYSAWWVITVADYAAMTGNKDYLIKHMPDIKRIIRQIDRYVDEEGQMHFDCYFVDWPTHGKPDEYAGVRAVNIMAAKRAVSAAEELKEEDGMFPPELSYREPYYGPILPEFNEFCARTASRLQISGQVNSVAILYPIESLQYMYSFNWEGHPYYGGPTCEKNNYLRAGQHLIRELNCDFTFLHPEVLEERCVIEGGRLVLKSDMHFQRYSVVIIPGMKAMSFKTLEKLKSFAESGGTLVALSELPEYAVEKGKKAELNALTESMFGPGQIGMQVRKRQVGKGVCYALPWYYEKDKLKEIILCRQSCNIILSVARYSAVF